MEKKIEPRIETPVPPQRQYPQENPDSEKNKGISQKPDPGKPKVEQGKKKK